MWSWSRSVHVSFRLGAYMVPTSDATSASVLAFLDVEGAACAFRFLDESCLVLAMLRGSWMVSIEFDELFTTRLISGGLFVPGSMEPLAREGSSFPGPKSSACFYLVARVARLQRNLNRASCSPAVRPHSRALGRQRHRPSLYGERAKDEQCAVSRDTIHISISSHAPT